MAGVQLVCDSLTVVTSPPATTGTGTAGTAGAATNLTAQAGSASSSTGSDNAGAGGNFVITAGAGGNAFGAGSTGNGGAGGNVNLVPGTGGTTVGGSAGANGEIQFNGAGLDVQYMQPATANAINTTFFIATRAYRIKAAKCIFSATAGGTSTLDITHETGTTAPAAGTSILNATFNLNATGNMIQNAALVGTAATLLLAAGDRLSVKFGQTVQSSTGIAVSVELAPM